MDANTILKIIQGLNALQGLLADVGINYDEVKAAQDAAEAEGREFDANDAQVFIDQAQSAVDRL